MNQPHRLSRDQQLRLAREILRAEAAAVASAGQKLDDHFLSAVQLLFAARQVIVTGMGKAGLIGQKIVATLCSTGTPSHFLHPAEAIHGDLGRLTSGDAVLGLSNSGETEELTRLLPILLDRSIPIVAVTRQPASTLGRSSNVVIPLGRISEACPLGLAPSASTTVMLAIGDALALVLSRLRGFEAEDFARLHPGGSLGRKLARVDEVMRPLAQCRVAGHQQTVREVLVRQNVPGRRTGAIMLIDECQRLRGIFTDSDLARLIANRDSPLDLPIRDVMTHHPKTALTGSRLREAVEVLSEHRISELPVVDEQMRPLGLLDVTDIVELLPAASTPPTGRERRADRASRATPLADCEADFPIYSEPNDEAAA